VECGIEPTAKQTVVVGQSIPASAYGAVPSDAMGAIVCCVQLRPPSVVLRIAFTTDAKQVDAVGQLMSCIPPKGVS
jgi:hypothetical protein